METIKNKGGITINAKNEELHAKSGYMVSYADYETQVDTLEKALDTIEEYKALYSDILENDKNYIGVWYDNGTYYIDISMHVMNKDNAIKLAKDNLQKTIFDIKNGTNICLDYNVKFYTLYNKSMRFVKQFDTSQALADFLGKTKRQVEKSLNTNKVLDTVGYIFSDTININEF